MILLMILDIKPKITTGLIISTVMVLPGEQYIKKKSFHSKFRISDSNIEYLFTKTWIYKKNKNN